MSPSQTLQAHPLFGLIAPYLPTALVVAYATALLSWIDVPVASSLRYAAYLFFVILLPGRLVWSRLMERIADQEHTNVSHSRLEQWVCGAAVGYAIEISTYSIARLLEHPRWYLVGPAFVVIATAFPRHASLAPQQRMKLSAGVNWALAGLAAYLVTWLWVIVMVRFPLHPYRPTDIDETFQLALIGELRHHFPPAYPYVEAGPLTYQWFVHAHMAASTWVTHLEPIMVYRRFDVLVLSVLAVLGTVVVAMRVTHRPWPGWLAGAVLVLVGAFDITGASAGQATPEERFLEGGLLLNSPTQTFAFAVSPAVIVLSLRLLSGRKPSPLIYVALGVGVLLLMGAKVTFVPVFLCGFVAAAVIALWRKPEVLTRAALAAAVCLGGMLAVTRILYAGDPHSLALEPGVTATFFAETLGLSGGGTLGAIVVSLTLLAMWLVPSAGAVGLAAPRSRWDLRVWWLLGASAGGLGAMMLLSHAGMSQLYFGRSVAPLLAVLSAWGLSVYFPPRTSRPLVLIAVSVALFGGLLLAAVRFVTERWRTVIDVDGDKITAAAVPVWANLPAIGLLVIAALLARAIVRDATAGRRVLQVRFIAVFLVGLGLARTFAFSVGHFPAINAEKTGLTLERGAVKAAKWLRSVSEPNDRVITNGHCIHGVLGEECDARHFWMSALTERRFVLEGWAYTRFQETWPSDFWGDPGFLAQNDRLFLEPSEDSLERFLDNHPAEWLFATQNSATTLDARVPGLKLRYRNSGFVVYEIVIGSAN